MSTKLEPSKCQQFTDSETQYCKYVYKKVTIVPVHGKQTEMGVRCLELELELLLSPRKGSWYPLYREKCGPLAACLGGFGNFHPYRGSNPVSSRP